MTIQSTIDSSKDLVVNMIKVTGNDLGDQTARSGRLNTPFQTCFLIGLFHLLHLCISALRGFGPLLNQCSCKRFSHQFSTHAAVGGLALTSHWGGSASLPAPMPNSVTDLPWEMLGEKD